MTVFQITPLKKTALGVSVLVSVLQQRVVCERTTDPCRPQNPAGGLGTWARNQ